VLTILCSNSIIVQYSRVCVCVVWCVVCVCVIVTVVCDSNRSLCLCVFYITTINNSFSFVLSRNMIKITK
jgi:hypothetical protein